MIALTPVDFSPQPTASGRGPDAYELCVALDAAYEHLLQPVNMTQWRDALTAMTELPYKYGQPGWDGEDAEPLSEESWTAACRALSSLWYAKMRAPEVFLDADGEVAFEWSTPRKSVIFTFQQNGMLSHTALYDGVQEQPGSVVFTDVIPASLLDKIARVY